MRSVFTGMFIGLSLVLAFGIYTNFRVQSNSPLNPEYITAMHGASGDLGRLEELSRVDPYQRDIIVWVLLFNELERKYKVPTLLNPKVESLMEASIRSTSGQSLMLTLEMFETRVLGYDEADLSDGSVQPEISMAELQALELRTSDEFRSAYRACHDTLSDRYSSSLAWLYSYFEAAYDSLRPKCPELKELI